MSTEKIIMSIKEGNDRPPTPAFKVQCLEAMHRNPDVLVLALPLERVVLAEFVETLLDRPNVFLKHAVYP